jgi:CheY-like chemotaxis protein
MKGLFVENHVSGDVPLAVLGDPVRIRQIVLNLLVNAVKFTERGGIKLAIESLPVTTGRVLVRISVHDTGIGIDPDTIPQLFEKFRQADASTTRKFGGTGLGLAIARELTEMMGGTIWAEPVESGGSVFRVEIPFEITDWVTITGTSPEGSESLAGLRILLAEDNVINQRVADRMLRRLGCTVDIAANGVEAVAKWGSGSYDAILLDWQMPEMDGPQTAQWIRRAEKGRERIPIIAVTANAMSGDRQKCLDSGMDGYVAKPIQLAALHAALVPVAHARSLQSAECEQA